MNKQIMNELTYTYLVCFVKPESSLPETQYVDYVSSREEAIASIKSRYGKKVKIVSAKRLNYKNVLSM